MYLAYSSLYCPQPVSIITLRGKRANHSNDLRRSLEPALTKKSHCITRCLVHPETFKAPSRFNSSWIGLSLVIKLLLRCIAVSFNRKMRLVHATTLYITLFTHLIANAAATSITLSQFQQISGFSETCTAAYNTPLNQCTQSDFENGRSCSMSCVEALEKVSAYLTTACAGIKAYPDTLIGLFFGGHGVEVLCPNVHDSGGSTGSTGGITGGNSGGNSGENSGGNNGGNNGGNSGGNDGGGAQTTQTTAPVMTSKAPQEPSATSTGAQASTTQQTTQQTTQTQSAAASTPTSLLKSTVPNTPPAVPPTINSASTLTQTGLAGLKSSTVEQSVSSIPSTSTTSTAQPDRNSNGNSGGSGGTPFDISASSHQTAATSSMLAFTLGLIAAFCYV